MMKMKYLSLALSAVLATTLTACGGSDDKHPKEKPVPADTDKKDDVKKDDVKKDDVKDADKPDMDKDGIPDATDPDIDGDGVPNETDKDPKDATVKDVIEPNTGSEEGVAVSDKNNANDASIGGVLDKNPTVGTQNYTRGVKSKFNTGANPQNAGDLMRGSKDATNFVKLQNTEMTNIVVARNKEDREGNRVQFYVGTSTNDRSNPHSLQTLNVDHVATDMDEAFVTNHTLGEAEGEGRDSGLVYLAGTIDPMIRLVKKEDSESLASGTLDTTAQVYLNTTDSKTNTNFTDTGTEADDLFVEMVIAGKEDVLTDSRSRILGADWTNDENDVVARTDNSFMFRNLDEEVSNNSDVQFDVTEPVLSSVNNHGMIDTAFNGLEKLSLQHVQYGRVTNLLDDIDKITSMDPRSYKSGQLHFYQIDPQDDGSDRNIAEHDDLVQHLSVSNNSDHAVNNYFFRGVNRPGDTGVKALKKEGSATYYGQAIMYGIDNSFHGGVGGIGSNSVSEGADVIESLGNFVYAKADFGTKKVTGDVYNVWRKVKSSKGSQVRDPLVTFSGDIKGANSIEGTAKLTYGDKSEAHYQGAFYGNEGSEMGGSFNPINGSDYGDVTWGGVFGAQTKESSSSGFETEAPVQ